MKATIEKTRQTIGILAITSATLMLSACSDSKKATTIVPAPTSAQSYTVKVTNLTANQPFSPIALLFHSDNVTIFTAGQPASVPLEKLAEGGDSADFDSVSGINNRLSASAPLAPGKSTEMSFTLEPADIKQLSVATMLVNTNDAFTGVQKVELGQFRLGESRTYRTMAYDNGTEGNSEARGTIPGPADNGQGFNPARDDVNRVYVHAGVISSNDGLVTSVLTASHRFDNPAANISITRTK